MASMRWLVLLMLMWSSCATNRLFAPRENGNGSGPRGHPAAVYPLDQPAIGEVRLWSGGAQRVALAGGEVTRLNIGFELENTSPQPMRLDTQQMRVRSMVTDGDAIDELSPVTVSGPIEAAPEGTTRVQVEFEPGEEVWPRTIGGFDLHWTVIADGQRFSQVTPFEVFRPQPIYWDDDPYWSWGFGWGFGWQYSYCR